MDLMYFSKKNKPEFNLILPKIRRYIMTQNALHTSFFNTVYMLLTFCINCSVLLM